MRKLFTCLVLALSCTRATQETKVAIPPPPPQGIIVDASRPKPALDELQPLEVIPAVDAIFRLTPDRRVLIAVSHIYELSTGRAKPKVEIDFREGIWRIKCASQDVGALPEAATFSADLDLLTQWSARLQPLPSSSPPSDVLKEIDQYIQAFTPPNLFAAVDLIAKRSKPAQLDRELVVRAAHVATLLAAQVFDWFELGDPLLARALALLAMARRIDAQCCRDDEALIARILNYPKEAEVVAGSLARSSFAAAFVLGIPSETTTTSDPAFDWLEKRGAFRRSSLSDPRYVFRGSLDVQKAPLLIEISSFEDQVGVARAEESIILRELESNQFSKGTLVFNGEPEWWKASQSLISSMEEKIAVQRFDRALPTRVASLKNSLIDDESIRSYYEANFYAALFKEFAFHHYRRGDRGGAKAFLASLGKPASPTSGEVIAWMNALIDAHYEAASGTHRPVDVLKSMPLVGGWRRAELVQAYGEAIGANQAAVRGAALEVHQHLDCRPGEMYAAGQIAMSITDDPKRRDAYISRALERSPFLASSGELAFYRFSIGDRLGLRTLANSAPNDADRAGALSYLSQLGEADSAFTHQKFEEILEGTFDISALSAYATYLNKRGESAVKERVMRRWLNKWSDRADDITRAWVASSLANALERQGKYQEAYAAIAPYVAVGSFNVMTYAASILQHVGRTEEANQLATQTMDRYPGATSRAAFAAILWREGRYPDAAALFDPTKATYSIPEAIYAVPEQFVETFKDANPANAISAYAALIAASLNWQLLDAIPQKALDDHHPELAFALADRLLAEPSRVPAANRPESITALLLGYRVLKEQKGADTALVWLQGRLPSPAAMQAILIFYQQADYDLVQRFASAVPDQIKTPEVAALEAASLLSLRVPETDVRWQKLKERIRLLPDSPGSLPIARYLAGFVDEPTFFAAAKTRQQHPDAEYFAGVKALAYNDYERALPLMIAASYGPQDYPPVAWGLAQLSRWSFAHASWEKIAKEHL